MYQYYPDAVSLSMADVLQVLNLQQYSVSVYGKTYPQPRLTAWYGSQPYTYSQLTLPPQAFPPLLQDLKRELEAQMGVKLDSMLANFYRDGHDKLGWHADDEPIFGEDPAIVSVSFGAVRDFKLRKISDHSVQETLKLEDRSVLVMPSGMQREWQHCLPARKRVSEPRLNLTFRPLGHVNV
jgi:alkylated DNA repair dioxygenase AlkB